MRLIEVRCALLAACVLTATALASIPEPDAILYGNVRLDGIPVTASDPVTVRAKVNIGGTDREVGSYRMGANVPAGDHYALRIRLESLADGSVQSASAALVGQSVKIVAQRDGEGEVTLTDSVVTQRGLIRRLNLPNQSPTVDAGADQSVYEGQTVSLHASGIDLDGDPLAYAWTQATGKTIALAGAATADASFTAPTIATLTEGSMTFSVTANDGQGVLGSDSVNVRVWMMGDINPDDSVDVVDLLMFVEAFGSLTGDSNYDARCDFSPDGSVDVVDLLIFVENFGRIF